MVSSMAVNAPPYAAMRTRSRLEIFKTTLALSRLQEPSIHCHFIIHPGLEDEAYSQHDCGIGRLFKSGDMLLCVLFANERPRPLQ